MARDIQSAKAILLFYLAGFGNEELAKRAGLETYRQYQKQLKKKSKDFKKNVFSFIVKITNKTWQKYKHRINSHFFSNFQFWELNVNSKIWKNFYKQASENEFLILIWSKILNFSEQQIAMGLDLTEGTIRYRTGRALEILGKINKNE